MNDVTMKVNPKFRKSIKHLATDLDLSMKRTGEELAEIFESSEFKDIMKRRKRK